jgi:LysM repeat protein
VPPPVASGPVPALTPPTPTQPPSKPSFDVVRVNPDGRAVIAGRSAPGSHVTVLDGDQPIGSVDADQRGEWVLLPDKPLDSGTRELTVKSAEAGQPAKTSDQSVVLNVPAPKDGGPSATLAVVMPKNGGGSVVLQTPQNSAGLARSGELVLGSVDYDEHGELRINGKAPPGAVVQAYLNDKLAGRTQVGADGNWHIVPAEPVPPGSYSLRLDRVQQDGKVLSRLEVPFVRTDKGELLTQVVSVVPGNSLWRIAQRIYGHGLRYTVIYEANRAQIKDPDLIYPGQVFVLPKIN